MSVSVNTSLTAPIRTALSSNLSEATRAGIAMATGNAINHAYEDPTGLAIGSSMKSERDILSVVATGIQQSQSMLYIAEEGLKAAENVVNQMETILARAKLGYMTDELVQNTLSPAYNQMKAELNRIADSINFNGQKLLNGTGGKVTTGVRAQINQNDATVDITNAKVSFTPFGSAAIVSGISATTINNDSTPKSTTGELTITANGITPQISGGTLTVDATSGDYILSGATITVKGASVTDKATPTNSATADLTISGVTLTFDKTKLTLNSNGTLTSTVAPTISGITSGSIVFSNIVPSNAPNSIVSISAVSSTTPTMTLTNASITDVDVSYTSSGGSGTTSTFNFVTGTNLAKDVIQVKMPNISLNDTAAAPSVISTLNTTGIKSGTMPTGLTNLTSIADADKDIALVAALREHLVIARNALGAYQLRFVNLSDQLVSSVEQIDSAQAAILNADLPTEAEKAVTAKVNLNLAISQLTAANEMKQTLQRIVTG